MNILCQSQGYAVSDDSPLIFKHEVTLVVASSSRRSGGQTSVLRIDLQQLPFKFPALPLKLSRVIKKCFFANKKWLGLFTLGSSSATLSKIGNISRERDCVNGLVSKVYLMRPCRLILHGFTNGRAKNSQTVGTFVTRVNYEGPLPFGRV